MSWKTVEGSDITYTSEAWTYLRGVAKVCLEYNDESVTTTSVEVRFKLYKNTSGGYYDSMYLLYNPVSESQPGTLYLIKPYNYYDGDSLWPYYSSSFILTKKYSDITFTLQPYWLINNGYNAVYMPETLKNNVSLAYKYFSNERVNYRHVISNKTYSIAADKTVATNITTGSVTAVTDNYDNSYTVTVRRGDEGNNNPVTGARIWWCHEKIGNQWSYTEAGNSEAFSGETKSKTIFFTPTSEVTRSVVGGVTTTGKYGGTTNSDWQPPGGTNIRQYVAPKKATNLSISFTKSRFTLRDNWTLSWEAAEPGTGTSSTTFCPVKGYRLRLFRKRGNTSWVTLPIRDSSGVIISTASPTNPSDKFKDIEDIDCIIYPSKYTADELQPGDQIKFSVVAYTRFGQHNDGSMLPGEETTLATPKTINNAGIVHVKVNNQWKEGQVYVKANGQWKEAETVNIKTSTGWEESQ